MFSGCTVKEFGQGVDDGIGDVKRVSFAGIIIKLLSDDKKEALKWNCKISYYGVNAFNSSLNDSIGSYSLWYANPMAPERII